MNEYPLLSGITCSADVRKLTGEQLTALEQEIRTFLVETVGKSGGHLASNLGVVELTLALHRALDLPHDRILWDVGHQSYVHKLLTGRFADFAHLREPGGLSGFTRRDESEYDPFGAGHSSTALSAALGFAKADELSGSDATTVAVVGDGAFSGGMVHEALNNCSGGLRVIIILNENEMSIGKTTGRLASYLTRIRSTASWYRLKRGTASFLRRIPLIGKALYRGALKTKIFFKNAIYGTNYYEDLGFYYMGPYDGHNTEMIEQAVEDAKLRAAPVLIHVKTVKGKGYPPAEGDPSRYHSIVPASSDRVPFHEEMAKELVRMAEKDETIVAVTAAMADGTGLSRFAEAFPQRFFDVGIAEEHAVTFAAGMAANGMKPYVAVYSTFLQRAYDQILHDVALQHLPVRFCIDRAGPAIHDGPTHHGIFDVAYLSQMPDLIQYTPATRGSLRAMLAKMNEMSENPSSVRYPNAPENEKVHRAFYADGDYTVRGFRCDRDLIDCDAVILTYGTKVADALNASGMLAEQGIRCGICLLEQLTPYEDLARRIAPLLPEKGKIVFLEEGIYEGGAAMCLGTELMPLVPEFAARYVPLAIRDPFAVPDTLCRWDRFFGISAEDVVSAVTGKDAKEQSPAVPAADASAPVTASAPSSAVSTDSRA